jgi:hypothetical protein
MEFIVISAAGLIAAAWLALRAWAAAPTRSLLAQGSLLLAYCALLVGPASQIYARVDTWQDLASIARAVKHDAIGKPLILFAPDETTRAMIDMYARTAVDFIPGPIDDEAIDRLRAETRAAPQSLILAQLPGGGAALQLILRDLRGGRGEAAQPPNGEPRLPVGAELPPWAGVAQLRVAKVYSLPYGRRYALFEANREAPTNSR